MKEKEKSNWELGYEDGANVGCAVISWFSCSMNLTLGLIAVGLRLINWEQFFWVFGILIIISLLLAISYTYDVYKFRKKFRKNYKENDL